MAGEGQSIIKGCSRDREGGAGFEAGKASTGAEREPEYLIF